MSRIDTFIWFVSLVLSSLLVGQFVLARLKKKHPELFSKFGYPSIQESNLGAKYWVLQKFVLWGHFSEVNDIVLHGLCVLSSFITVAGLLFFFLCVRE
jgi:hypothetical protein